MLYSEAVERYVPRCAQEEKDRELMLRYIRAFPDILTRDNETMHFTASCWITNARHDRVLMAYHNIYRAWAWTGGHADGDGDLLRVALREANEETGLTDARPVTDMPVSLEIVGVDGHVRRGVYVASHLHLNLTYMLVADDAQRLVIKPDENSGVKWMTLEQTVEDPENAYMCGIYEKLNQRLRELA